jgi:hypothetical protein
MRAHTIGACFLFLVTTAACGGGGASTPGGTTPGGPGAGNESTLPPRPTAPDSDKVTWKKDPPGKNCHQAPSGGDLVAGVTSLASACIDTGKMKQVGTPTQGDGKEGDPAKMVTTIPLKAQANHCYRFFGLAEATVKDLDIAVMDSGGKACGEDLNDTNHATTLDDGNICFKVDDTVNVNVATATGFGKWAVEIWSD